MYKGKRLLAIIPARSGSKGIRDKNIKELLGKPLMAYAIDAALGTGVMDDVIVSTDSERYADIARKHGADVPFLRPFELSSDTALAEGYIFHALGELDKKEMTYDFFVVLQPTSPLRTTEHIMSGIRLAVDEKLDSVVSFSIAEHPPQLCFELPEDLSLGGVTAAGTNRQELEPLYRINGMLYVSSSEAYKKYRTWYGPSSKALIIDSRYAVDIDTELDFEFAEFLMKRGMDRGE